jgi:hypothetical protein
MKNGSVKYKGLIEFQIYCDIKATYNLQEYLSLSSSPVFSI